MLRFVIIRCANGKIREETGLISLKSLVYWESNTAYRRKYKTRAVDRALRARKRSQERVEQLRDQEAAGPAGMENPPQGQQGRVPDAELQAQVAEAQAQHAQEAAGTCWTGSAGMNKQRQTTTSGRQHNKLRQPHMHNKRRQPRKHRCAKRCKRCMLQRWTIFNEIGNTASCRDICGRDSE